MESYFIWYWWAGAAIVMIIAEIFVPGLFLLCLGVGCGGGAVAAALGGGPGIQLLTFSAISLMCFLTLRPLLMKKMWNGEQVRTNVDALVGRRARVTQDFEPGLRLGRVAIDGDDWRAECTVDRSLRSGDVVQVVRVESNTLIVEPLQSEHS
ncbi:MAG: NfeD family protein [Flavobacteriales bacterium]|nr:NfeD family protein [Flavobacteriales bacterium]